MIAYLFLLVASAFHRLFAAHAGASLRAYRSPAAARACNLPKPDWVPREVLRLKALMPDAGCRTLEMVFNRRYAVALGVRVGKTYVARLLIAERRPGRAPSAARRAPREWPPNARWGADLTSRFDAGGRRCWILGIVDYRSRASILLTVLARKSAAALASALAGAFERFGAPRVLVTDNEGPFRSALWKRFLARLGVRHRRIRPYCPWQNGRIERFFGTLKRKLRARRIDGLCGLQRDLDIFRYWYNRIRPHQALRDGASRLHRTPAEVWHRAQPREGEGWFEAWNGLLRGYACRI